MWRFMIEVLSRDLSANEIMSWEKEEGGEVRG